MTISYQWLLEYLPEALPVNDFSAILTSIGLEVEAIEPIEQIKGGLQGLVIGEVLTCTKHPNADKLSVTTVATGTGDPVQIVCGAPNVAAGQKVVVAPVGATVHPTTGEAFLIRKAKIRGEESAGMICAEDEIGLGSSHAGIMILPADAVVGTLASHYFNIPLTDYAIHIGLTPNRSDANSHIGVARDVCAYLAHHRGGRYVPVLPQVQLNPAVSGTDNPIQVTIEVPEACPRYAGISLQQVRVGASPEWLQQRLAAIGVRSINNIVDITNYVLHEYGQPLHAFDADKINGAQIKVRFLPEGTPFMGLDGKERKLLATDLTICDSDGPMAMGGVFGGQDSGITEATTHVFLESAYFHPKTIRRTSLHHGLRTDAATHFEKGVDVGLVLPALERAAGLIAQLAGGVVVGNIIDVYPKPVEPTRVQVSYHYLRSLSGKAYPAIAIQELLTAAGFRIEEETTEGLLLLVPGNKPDVTQPADIVEEILRIDGLDNIQIPGRLDIALTKPMPSDRQERERVANLLCGMGLQEIVTNSIVNSKYYAGQEGLVHMVNSLSSELDTMRPSLLESGLETVAYNCNRKNTDLCLFELGNVYGVKDGQYHQAPQLGIWCTGNARPAHWNQSAEKASIYYLKGILANMLAYANIPGVTATANENGHITWSWKKQPLATAYTVPKATLSQFDIKQEVYYACIYWDTWLKAMAAGRTAYQEVPKYPAVQRDLALVLDNTVQYQDIATATNNLRLDSLRSFGLFDVFESEKLGAGKKSYALNYTFQLNDRTLTDAETDQLMKQLMDTYRAKLGATIRE